jgi:hypothetical protein
LEMKSSINLIKISIKTSSIDWIEWEAEYQGLKTK